MIGQVRTSVVSSFAALGVATCCVMPMTMLLLGLGGSWIAVFGKIAAASYYVLAGSTLIVGWAWIAAIRRGSARRLRGWLAFSTALTALAWALVFNETRINDILITLM